MNDDKELTTRTYGPGYKQVQQDPERCVEAVYSGWGSHQCRSKRGRGPGGLYCGKHDPSAVAARNEKALAKYRDKVDNSPLALMRRRAEAAEAQVERLKGVLERLASSEAFHHSHVLVARDAELVMRMDFARSALEAKP